jgi:hypothetical protein
MGTYQALAFNANAKICRSSVLALLVLTDAFAQHSLAWDNIIVNSPPPAAVALARFIAHQPTNGRTPVETIEIEASLPS